MTGESWLYLLSVLLNAVNLFLQVFFTIMYSDLEWCVSNALPEYLSPACPAAFPQESFLACLQRSRVIERSETKSLGQSFILASIATILLD